MKDWKRIAEAYGLPLTAHELDRITTPLAALEETFRPLIQGLTPNLEPDIELHLGLHQELYQELHPELHPREEGE